MQHMTMSYGHRELRLFSCVIMAINAPLFSICGVDMMSLYAVRNSNGLSLRVDIIKILPFILQIVPTHLKLLTLKIVT